MQLINTASLQDYPYQTLRMDVKHVLVKATNFTNQKVTNVQNSH
jgi:hypothetical protein